MGLRIDIDVDSLIKSRWELQEIDILKEALHKLEEEYSSDENSMVTISAAADKHATLAVKTLRHGKTRSKSLPGKKFPDNPSADEVVQFIKGLLENASA